MVARRGEGSHGAAACGSWPHITLPRTCGGHEGCLNALEENHARSSFQTLPGRVLSVIGRTEGARRSLSTALQQGTKKSQNLA